jgi:hypothetical protein
MVMRRSVWLTPVAALTMTLAFEACAGLVGIGELPFPRDGGAPTDGSAATDGGAPTEGGLCDAPITPIAFRASCSTCAEAHCCGEAAACAGSLPCGALEGCLAACDGDPACRSQCTRDNPVTDHRLSAALDACLASNCADACGLSCGGLSKLADPDAAAACAHCIQVNFCAQAQSCATSLDCQSDLLCRENCVTGDCAGACSLPDDEDGGRLLCLESCASSQCISNCGMSLDSGEALYSAFTGPVSGSCSTECEAGNHWSCVGHVQWPAAKSRQRTITVGFVDFIASQGETGVAVKMCAPQDPTCIMPIDQGVTDGGLVTLTDRTGATNGGTFGLEGFFDLSSPSLFPTIVYWGFPLSETHGLLATPIPVFEALELPAVVALAGANVTLDPGRGHLAFLAIDCFGNQAVGVTFSASPVGDAQLFYGAGQTLSSTGPTDKSGSGFYFNVPPGSVDLYATPLATGVTASHLSVSVRAGTITEVSLAPTP